MRLNMEEKDFRAAVKAALANGTESWQNTRLNETFQRVLKQGRTEVYVQLAKAVIAGRVFGAKEEPELTPLSSALLAALEDDES